MDKSSQLPDLPPEMWKHITGMAPIRDLSLLSAAGADHKTKNLAMMGANAQKRLDKLIDVPRFEQLLRFIIADPSRVPAPIKVEARTRDESLSNFDDLAIFTIETDLTILPNKQYSRIEAQAFGFSVQLHYADSKLNGMYITKRKYKYDTEFTLEMPYGRNRNYLVNIEKNEGTYAYKSYSTLEEAQKFYLNMLRRHFGTSNEFWIQYAGKLDISLDGVDTIDGLIDQVCVPFIAHSMAVILKTQEKEPAHLKQMLRLANKNATAGLHIDHCCEASGC